MKTAIIAGLLLALAFAGPASATAAVQAAPSDADFICPLPVFPVTIVCDIIYDFCEDTDWCESVLG